jgi:hypothetical protein
MYIIYLCCYWAKLSDLNLKTQPKQLLGFLQGSLTEGPGLVQLISLYLLVQISSFLYWIYYLPFYKTRWLNEEVNRTDYWAFPLN